MYRACLLACGLILSLAAAAQTTPSTYVQPGYPRLAVLWIGGSQNEDQAAVQQQLARGSLAIIATGPGWQGSCNCSTLQQAVAAIKALNPSELVFQYIKNNEASSSSASAVYNEISGMHWFLYPSGSSGTPVSTSDGYAVNNTTYTHSNSSGQNFLSWYASWAYNTFYLPATNLDGFYTDNVVWQPSVSGDWSLSGSSVSPGSTSEQWEQQGYVSFFANLNRLMPNKFQIGNVATWGQSGSNLSLYNGMLQGGFMEGLIGFSWSVETCCGWKSMMAEVTKTMNALAQPQLGVFAQIGSPTDYQSFRYGLTSAMMTNAYFAFSSASGDNSNYSSNPWFDEYAWQGKLGPATTATPAAAWQNGVYRRDFQGGIALVNPKGNGPQTVTLETTYTRLSSTCPVCQNQVPSVNSGQPVTTLTLQDRDGIILLRSGGSTGQTVVPEPPTQVTVH